jgi:hypothetical protein
MTGFMNPDIFIFDISALDERGELVPPARARACPHSAEARLTHATGQVISGSWGTRT